MQSGNDQYSIDPEARPDKSFHYLLEAMRQLSKDGEGLLLTGQDEKRFGYQKGTLAFVTATGRLPKEAEAKKFKEEMAMAKGMVPDQVDRTDWGER